MHQQRNQPREPRAALGQQGNRVVPPELPHSAQLGDKSSAELSAAAPCKVQGGASEAEAGDGCRGALELVGDTAMFFEDYSGE